MDSHSSKPLSFISWSFASIHRQILDRYSRDTKNKYPTAPSRHLSLFIHSLKKKQFISSFFFCHLAQLFAFSLLSPTKPSPPSDNTHIWGRKQGTGSLLSRRFSDLHLLPLQRIKTNGLVSPSLPRLIYQQHYDNSLFYRVVCGRNA